ncbi:hypothetical protein GGI20_006033, partial [Coemansia sp. BCRC 34301]
MLLDLPNHIIARIISRDERSSTIGQFSVYEKYFLRGLNLLKVATLCQKLRSMSLQAISKQTYLLCSDDFGRPNYTMEAGLPLCKVVEYGFSKYTQKVLLDVSYEFILSGTAASMLAAIANNGTAFIN